MNASEPLPDSTPAAKNWWLIYLAAIVICALLVGLLEARYRRLGVQPTVLDDKDLWAQERLRLRAAGKEGVALLGTSRLLFGVDPKRLKARLNTAMANASAKGKNYQPIMLAINGAYPLAALDDLAHDQQFNGIAVVDVDAEGLVAMFHDMQLGHVKHYQQDFGPSRRLHRRLLTQWQRRMVVADPSYGVVAIVQRRVFDQPPPQPRYATIFPNRAGALDFQRIDPEPLRVHFAKMKWEGLKNYPPPNAEQWLANLAKVRESVAKIQARGGQVMFFCPPTRGEHRAADLAGYPREKYWDKAEAILGAPMVYGDDIAIIKALNTPDGSHVDARDRDQLTDGLYEAMRLNLKL